MAPVRSTTSPRQRRHAAPPRPWAQFPWTFLGMAFVTTLFLASNQAARTVSSVPHDTQVVYGEPTTP